MAIGLITLNSINLDGTPGPGCTVGAPGPFPTVPTEFAITGEGFATVPSNEVIVRFTAVGDATPFLWGHAATVDVEGLVFNDTLICGETPSVTLCGAATVEATIEVILASGVRDDSTAATHGPVFTITFNAPTITALSATCFGSLTPTTLTITGMGFGNNGDEVTVRWASAENLPGGDPIFADGTSPLIELLGTVSGGGTIVTTTTPKATNQVEDILPNPLHRVSDPIEDATIQIFLHNGSCTDPANAPVVEFDAPEGDTILGENIADPTMVPQTIPTEFVINGTAPIACPDGFGPAGATVQVSFAAPGFPSAPADAFQLDANGAGTADFDIVDAVVISATEIRGSFTPAVFARVDFVPVVRIHFEDGMIVPVTTAFTYVAPPIIDTVTNGTAGGGNGVHTALAATEFLGCHTDVVDIVGVNFDAPPPSPDGLIIYDANTGITRRLGTNDPVGIDLADFAGPGLLIDSATQKQGFGRIEGLLADLDTDGDGQVTATVRITNADGQFGELDATWLTQSAAFDRTLDPVATNNNTSVAIDPTSVVNDFDSPNLDGTVNATVVTACGADTTSPILFAFQSTVIRLDQTEDGGFTWNPLPNVGAAQDGFGAFEFRNFGMVQYDAFGNLWLSYLVDDLTNLTANVVLLVSSNDGATWTDVSDPSMQGYFIGAADRPCLAVGPAGDPAVTTDQAATVTWVNFDTPFAAPTPIAVLAAGRLATGLGVTGAAAPATIVSDGAVGNALLFQHARCAIGPVGELYVSWNDLDFPNGFFVIFDRDRDGLFGPGFGFDTDTVVDNVTLPAVPRPSSPDFGPPVPLQDLAVIATGSHQGRIVMAYETVITPPGGGPNPDTTAVITRTSDTNGFLWSAAEVPHQADNSDQYLPALVADPITGRVHLTWNDTKSDPLNEEVERYAATSADGRSWSAPLLLSLAPSLAPGGDGEFTDYGIQSGVDALGGCVWGAWAESPAVVGAAPPRKNMILRLFQQTPPSGQ